MNKRLFPTALPLLAALLLPTLTAPAQRPLPYDDALPTRDDPRHPMDLAQLDLATPLPLGQTPPPGRTPAPHPAMAAAPTPRPAAVAPAATPNVAATPAADAPPPPPSVAAGVPASPGSIRLNFQNAPLNDVLNYLSAAAGFIITQETPVTGTVNVVSQQSMNAEEAVDLLNTILAEKGYVALRNGRILKIVSSQGAQTRDLPVNVSSDPAEIPRKDSMVTQILPVRFVEVGKLVDNLRPLLSDKATITSNDTSNAIILTDTQTNIHRIAEIIHALDTSISSISQIRVFSLRFSDAKNLADVLTQLFSPETANNRQGQPGNPFFGALAALSGRGGGRGGGGGQGGAPAAPESAAREAAARVIVVSDETSNSVIVSAPDELMSNVAAVIQKLDTSTNDITETQIFRLEHADATELANVLSTLYADAATVPNANGGNNNNRGGNNRPGQPQPQPQAGTSNRSERALLQARVVAVADARTNSVLVSASHDTMSQVALTIGRLDASGSKKQHVRIITLAHADPDNVATILRGMYSTTATNTSTATQPSLSVLTNRTTTGASNTITGTLGTSGSGSGSGSLNR